MAKRYKMSETLPQAAKKVFNMQKLMTTPSAEKLEKLDGEMKLVLQQKNLGVAEKVRLFEEKLAQFRQLQDRVISNGSLTHFGSTANKPADGGFTDEQFTYLRAIIQDTIGKLVANQPRPEADVEDWQSAVDEYPSYASSMMSTESPIPPEANMPQHVEENQTSRRMTNQLPEAVSRKRKSVEISEKPKKAGKTSELNAAKREIMKILKASGVETAANNRIAFPVMDSAEQQKLRRSRVIYANSSLTKSLNYLLSHKPDGIFPTASSKLIERVHQSLKSHAPNFNEILERYPNLKMFHQSVETPAVMSLEWATS